MTVWPVQGLGTQHRQRYFCNLFVLHRNFFLLHQNEFFPHQTTCSWAFVASRTPHTSLWSRHKMPGWWVLSAFYSIPFLIYEWQNLQFFVCQLETFKFLTWLQIPSAEKWYLVDCWMTMENDFKLVWLNEWITPVWWIKVLEANV